MTEREIIYYLELLYNMWVENPHNQKILSSGSKLGSSKNQDKMCLHWKGINEKISNINKIMFCLSQGTSLFLEKKKFPKSKLH